MLLNSKPCNTDNRKPCLPDSYLMSHKHQHTLARTVSYSYLFVTLNNKPATHNVYPLYSNPCTNHVSHHLLTANTASLPSSLSSFPSGFPKIAV